MRSTSPAKTWRSNASRILLGAALVATAFATQAAGGSGGFSEARDGGAPRENADWMKAIPDWTPIGRISLVGTHDAATGKMAPSEPFVTPFAKTQAMKIDRQLAAGVRALDLRCKHTQNRCALHHGAIGMAQDLSEVLDMVTGFLRAHPSETVFLLINNPDGNGSDGKPENNTPANRLFAETFLERYWTPYQAFFWKGHHSGVFPSGGPTDRSKLPPLPKLGEVRGKMVVFQDFSPESRLGWFGFPGQNQYKPAPDTFRQWVHTDTSGYHVDNPGALDEFWQRKLPVLDHANEFHLVAGATPEDQEAVHMVWLNGSGGATTPALVARHANPKANQYIFGKIYGSHFTPRTGMLMTDFPDLNLIENVIALNYQTMPQHGFYATFEAVNDRLEVSVNGVDVFETSKAQATLPFNGLLRPGVNQIGVRLGNNDCFGTSLKLKLFRDQSLLTERDFRKRTSHCGRQLSWLYSLNTVTGEWLQLE